MPHRHAPMLLVALLGCGGGSAVLPPPADATAPLSSPQAAPPAEPQTVAPEPPSAPHPCGDHGCLLFETPTDAFRAVLAEGPSVLAVGEMHALAGTETIASATRRFTTQLLPLLEGRASDLVLELWVGDPSCTAEVEKVDRAQQEIREPQAATNPNEHVALGDASKALGIQPHVLAPTCDDYAAINDAGEDGVILMLQTIARLTTQKVTGLVARNRKAKSEAIVLAYGGAIHNDLAPAKGAASFSFGPPLAEGIGGYVAVDLIIPEFIRDTRLWRAQPWHAHYDPDAHPNRTILYHPRPGEYAIIFPRSPAPLASPADN